MTTQVQDRDRMLQVFLAQARGAGRNGDLLCDTIDVMLRMQAESGGRTMDNALVETLRASTEALEEAGVTYAITGSIASSRHGEPVSSLDVDLIVSATQEQTVVVARKLSPRFYAPEEMLQEAAQDQGFAKLIDNQTSFKVDLSFVEATGFLGEVLQRRIRATIGTNSPEFWFVTPEDIILMKLLWRRDTRSTKQWENALSVARVKGARMDWKYLFEQARTLDIEADLVALRDEAGI